MPEHYRSFMNRSMSKRKEEGEDLPEERLSPSMKIKVDQLFQLPKLRKIRGSLTRLA